MSDPRTPQTREAELPDALDQVPDAHPHAGEAGEHGSEDAALLAGADEAEGDIEQPPSPPDPAPQQP